MTKNRRDLTPRHISKFSATRARPSPAANIRVVIRVRPANCKESGDNQRLVVKCRDPTSLIFDPEEEETPFFFHGVKQRRRDLLKKQNKNTQFVYDRVFPEDATNAEVFSYTTRDLIDILMDGCNCSVFAYGATGAGKTYTMLGKPETPGITVLTIGELFLRKEQLSDSRDFELFVTYLEVYNENVRDLLKHCERPLQLREDAQLGVCVAGLTHKRITNADELFHLLDEGNRNRTQHPTDANAESSRSHAVFQVYLKMIVKTTGQRIIAKLSMIDLAGSERAAATGCKGIRFTEGANINKSLLALGNCINSLADGQKHVPYRDSKLTRILKDSLGGNCHTVMIANVSPSSLSFEDTYNTLKYATRAKKIKANVRKNVVSCGKSSAEFIKIIEGLNEENAKLKEEVARLKEELQRKQKEDKLPIIVEQHDDKEEITTTTTEKELSEATFSCTSTEASETTSEDLMEQMKQLFASYRQFENDLHAFVMKQQVHEKRLALREEERSLLLDNSLGTPDPKKPRIIEASARRRRSATYENEIKTIEVKIVQVTEEIKGLVKGLVHPDVKQLADMEYAKIEAIRARNDKATCDALMKVQAQELRTRASFMEHAASLLQPWHRLLTKRGLVTKDMQDVFEQLRVERFTRAADAGDSGLSAMSSASTSTEALPHEEDDDGQQEQRALRKRKCDVSATMTTASASTTLESTYMASTSGRGNKFAPAVADGSQLFKELQRASPSKRVKAPPLRSSPRIRQKENKTSDLLLKIRRPPAAATPLLSRHASKMLAQSTPKPPFR